jgi:outer membrane cobalamin receptor
VQVRREEDTIDGEIRNVPVVVTTSPQAGSGKGGGSGTGTGKGKASAATTFAFQSLNEDNVDTTYSAALEYRVTPVTHMHLTLGYSHHWFDREGGTVDAGDQWMLGSTYDVSPEVQVFGSYSQKVRFPTLQELFDPQMGNAALKPERSDDVEAGAAWSPVATVRLKVSGFHNLVADFIQNNSATQVFYNNGIVINGAEVTGSWMPWTPLQLQASYTYLDTRDSNSGLRTSYRPADIAQLQAVFVPAPDWTIYGSTSVYADQVVASPSNAAIQEELPNYVLVSLRIAKDFPQYGAEIYVRGTNLLNAQYVDAVGYPAAGRMIYGGATLRF